MATVLIVQDNASNYNSVQRVLSAQGHRVLRANSGLEGIQQADTHVVDLVVIDVDLPDMDGKGVATALRTRPHLQNVPIVALCRPDDVVTPCLAGAFGCTACFVKSLGARSMPQQVVTYLEQVVM